MPSSWSELPSDIVRMISDQLHDLLDYLRFTAVCRSWRLATNAVNRRHRSFIPYLIVPDESNGAHFTLLFPSGDRRTLRLRSALDTWRCFGSCHGWLAFTDLEAGVHLLNPFTGAKLKLPSISQEIIPSFKSVGKQRRRRMSFVNYKKTDRSPLFVTGRFHDGRPICYSPEDIRDKYLSVVCISSSDPINDPDCIIMVVFDDQTRLAYTRTGDTNWTEFGKDPPWEINGVPIYWQIMFHNGKFFATSLTGNLIIADFCSQNLRVDGFVPQPSISFKTLLSYIVVHPSSGELVKVDWEVRELANSYKTGMFVFSKIDMDGDGQEGWEVVEMLTDWTLFICNGSIVALPLSVIAGSYRQNSIYFLENVGQDSMQFMEHYDIKDKTIEFYRPDKCKFDHWANPYWIVPHL